MKIKDLDKLLELVDKLDNEPDIEEFDKLCVIYDFKELVKEYKDFLGSDKE